MKTRFSLLFIALLACQIIAAQVHISVSGPDTWDAEELRPYIGQKVIFDVPIVVCSNYGGALTVSTRRLYSPTNQAQPRTDDYKDIMRLNSIGSMSLYGVSGYHRCGEKIYNLQAKVNSTSSLSWISGEWRGNTRAELEAGIPDLGDYRLLICTMNLEYYLVATAGGSMGPRTKTEHQRQRKKVNNALTLINADAYGLVEIEQGQAALNEIASDLNDRLPERNYAYIDDGSKPNGTYTKAGFVYDQNKLRPIGAIQEIDAIVQNRKKMICFEEIATGERFVFSVNHFKAKSGSGSGSDADQGDGQGTYNATRVEEAQAVIDQYRRYYAQIKEKDLLIMGDLNAYAKEDPIIKFLDAGFIDLHRSFHADSSYSYQFRGLAGYLDHAICNESLRPQITGAVGFHINSDESDNFTYDKSSDVSMFRSSDHDPVLVGLKLDSTLTYDSSPTLNVREVMAGNEKTLTISNAFKDGQDSYYAIYDLSGRSVNATSDTYHKVESALQPVEMPAAPGLYILYVYYDHQVYKYKFIVR